MKLPIFSTPSLFIIPTASMKRLPLSSLILFLILLLAAILRLYKLSQFPPGLYSDEASLGYNAYSILKTGRDEWGRFLPATFQSFGDYKPPMTAYLTIPSIAAFGLNEFAVRFPSAILGTLSILLIYLLTKEVFKSRNISLLAAALLAISPWHLHLSRMSMLVVIENFFLTLGLYSFLKSTHNPRWLYLTSTSFVAAIYSYYGSRVTVPLLVIGLSLLFHRHFLDYWRTTMLSALLGLILISPLMFSIIREPQTLTGRAKYVSIFYNDSIRSQLWKTAVWHGAAQTPIFLTRFFDNKPYYYLRDITRRYLSHFSFSFLFLDGDNQSPFHLPHLGQVYLVDLVFVLIGLFIALKSRSKTLWALLIFMALSPITASLTFLTPAANRSFNLVTGWTILTALGIVTLFQKLKPILRYSLATIILILYPLFFTNFVYQYTQSLPHEIPDQFHYGTQELIHKLTLLEKNYSRVILTDHGGPLYIFTLLYKQYPPDQFLATRKVNPQVDELGWQHIDSFDHYTIPRNFNWNTYYKEIGSLYVGLGEEIPDACPNPRFVRRTTTATSWYPVIDGKVYYPNGEIAYKLIHLQELYVPDSL